MDMDSLKRCCDAVKASGIVVQMGTQVRSFPTSTGCRDLFRSGAIGKVSRIEQCRNGTKPYWYSWMERAEADQRSRTSTGRNSSWTGPCAPSTASC